MHNIIVKILQRPLNT